MMLTLQVDPEDYHVPSDGNLQEEIEDYVTDLIHEVDGIKILNIRKYKILEHKLFFFTSNLILIIKK